VQTPSIDCAVCDVAVCVPPLALHAPDPTSNLVLTLPGDKEGPGGVLVCAENYIYFRNQDHKELKAPIPRRYGMADDKGVLITAHAMHAQKNMFFLLVQSEFGDIYKVTLDYEEDQVRDLHVKYFDTVPTATSICVLKSGCLFVASECGNHYLFQFVSVGDDDDTAEGNTRTPPGSFVYFQARPVTNLSQVDEMDSLAPITDFKVADLAREHTPQIYAVCESMRHSGRSASRASRTALCCVLTLFSRPVPCPSVVACSAVWSGCPVVCARDAARLGRQ
jgi:splicing factor 3B subunit 3